MNLTLSRTYFPMGTNGDLYINGKLQCHTIELPWKNNQHQVSCIPEGTYRLRHRYTKKFGHHLEVLDVPGRSGILVHAANNAQKELKGCIAPVSIIRGEGFGIISRGALESLIQALRENPVEPMELTIIRSANN